MCPPFHTELQPDLHAIVTVCRINIALLCSQPDSNTVALHHGLVAIGIHKSGFLFFP